MRRLSILVVIVIMGATLVACGGSGAGGTRKLTLSMSDYAFKPATLELKVGETVTIELKNTGQLDHEVMFGRGLQKVNNRPGGYETDMFQAGGVTPTIVTQAEMKMPDGQHEHGTGVMVALPPGGKTATITFPVTEGMVGEWEMGCFQLSGVHYDSGMLGKVIVSK